MSSDTIKSLVEIDLPIGPNYEKERVLALVFTQSDDKQFTRLITSDASNTIVGCMISDSINGRLPEMYNAIEMGAIDAFLGIDKGSLDQILDLDYTLAHGQLTLARALHLMLTQQMSAGYALNEAVRISNLCATFESDMG